MVLFDDVVEVLDLPELNLCVLLEVVAGVRRSVGATLIDGNLRRRTILADRLAQEAHDCLAIPLRSQQEIDCIPCLVDGLVHSSAGAHPPLARPKGLVQQRHVLEHSAVETGMADLDASFFHHLLELAVANRVRDIPAHAPEDDLPLK